MNSSGKTVMKAAAVVTLLSVSERAFGFLYRIILSRSLGAEGMGLYYIALSVFGVLVTVAASGLPVSISRLMIKFRAEGDERRARGVVSAGVGIAICYGVIASAAILLFRERVRGLFSDGRSASLLFCMLPGLTFTAVYAALRGSFWGNGHFTAYAVIELIEEVVMVALGCLFLATAASFERGAKLAALAVALSYFVSFAAALIFYLRKGGRFSSPKGATLPLLSAALPITGMRTVNSLLNSAVAVLFPAMLIKAGLSAGEAVSAYAAAGAMAVPILFAPSSIIGSISLVLVPKLSGEFYQKRGDGFAKTAQTALFVATALACLLIPLFSAAGRPLCALLYDSAAAGQMVERYAVMLFPMTLSMMATSILNSMGMEKQTLGVFLASGAITLGAAVLLPRFFGAEALLIGYAASFTLNAAISLWLLQRKSPAKGELGTLTLKCVTSILPAALCGKAVAKAAARLPLIASLICICTATLGVQILTLFLLCGKKTVTLLRVRRSKTAHNA